MTSQIHISKKLIIGFIGIYFIRFLISLFMGLMPQDAYYYLYSENLALSYFDHPPMIAYILSLSSSIFGQSVLVIKLTDFFVSFLAYLSFYYLATLFLSKRKAVNAALFYGSTLQLTILSINTTPDVALIFFWTLTLIVLYKTLHQDNLYLWALSGIFIGLSFDSKYTGLFLLAGLFSFLIMSKKHRHLLFSKQIFLTLLFFLLTISPIIYWNVENEWISFAFQTKDRVSGAGNFSINPGFFFGNLGTQLMLLIPFLFAGVVFSLYKLSRKMIKKRAFLGDDINFLFAFSMPIIAFFFALSPFYWVKLNWIMPGYITASILASIYLGRKMLSYQIFTSLALHILLFIQVVYYVVNIKSDDTWFGWEQLADEVEIISKKDPNSFIFAADGYKTSAVLNFYFDEHVYSGNIVGENGLQFSIIDAELGHLDGRDAYFIDSEKNFKDLSKSNAIPYKLDGYFNEIIELDPIIIMDSNKRPVRKFLVYKCIGYKDKTQGIAEDSLP